MANIKSAQKRARQNVKRRQKNLARKTAIKTAVKKVLASLEKGDDIAMTKELFKDAEARLARAKSKGVIHQNTVARKISALAKKVAQAERAA